MDKIAIFLGILWNNLGGIVLFAILVAACVFGYLYLIKGKRLHKTLPMNNQLQVPSPAARSLMASTVPATVSVQAPIVPGKVEGIKTGSGKYHAMVLKPGVVDFTTISKPVGEIIIASGTLPYTGPCYLVKQTNDGKYVDFDERNQPYNADTSPSKAWICTHCDEIIKAFWSADVNWLQNPATWYAAAMIALDFIAVLVVLGG